MGLEKIWTNSFFEMEFLRQKIRCEKSELYFYHSSRRSWNCPTSKSWHLLRNSFIQSRHILLTFKLNTQNALKLRSSLCSSVLKKLLFNCKAVDYLRQYFLQFAGFMLTHNTQTAKKPLPRKSTTRYSWKWNYCSFSSDSETILSFLECLLKFSFSFHWWYH